MPTSNYNILSLVADNQALFDSLKILFERHFSLDGLHKKSDTLPNEQLGALLRARMDGIATVEDAFREIAQHKSTTTQPITINPAR